MTGQKVTGAEVLLRGLSDMGVECIFASPGSEWAPVWESLADPGLERKPAYVSSRHEEIAVAMASGYAKSTGKLGAVILHTTVGMLHAGMAIRAALHENVPMVVFAGESIAFGEGAGMDPGGHWLGQLADIGGPARLVERCAKWAVTVSANALLAATVQRACQLAMTPPTGPVLVSLPMEYLVEKTTLARPASAALPIHPSADAAGLDELAAMLLDAARPVIVTEECGRSLPAAERLLELSERLAIPVVETRTAGYLNFPRTHPHHAGFDAREIAGEADCILLLATALPWHPPSSLPRAGTKVAVLDSNPLRIELPYWGFRVDLCLPGALASSLEGLCARVRDRGGDARRKDWAEHWGKRHRDRILASQQATAARRNGGPMELRWVLQELNAMLPADAIVVEETITDRSIVNETLDGLKPGSFFAGAIGGLGTGLGTALGVKYANPERPVVLVIGDGALNYNPVLAGLGFAQEYRMPILIVVLNNGGFLSQKEAIPRYYPDGWAVKTNTYVGTAITPAPEYAALARIFAGHGETVHDPHQVRPSLERGLRALASGSLALIDMRVKPIV